MSVEIDGVNNIIKADTISEVTSANGVAIDGVTIKDGGISATTGSIVFNEASADVDFRVESNGNANMLFVDGGENHVGIGTNAPKELLHIEDAAPILRISDSNSTSEDDAVSKIQFFDRNNSDVCSEIISGTGSLADLIISNNNSRALLFQTNGNTERMRILGDGKISAGGETAPDTDAGGLTLDQNATDGKILSFKSSDVAHGMTDSVETDTYATFKKQSATKGGLQIRAFAEDNANERLVIDCQGDGNITTTKSASGKGAMVLGVSNKSSANQAGVNSNANLLTIANYTNTRFIFDAEGDFHADSSSTTYDAYDDAQLVRAYDLSHGKGVINSKFDKFVSYNHQKLADLELVGKEEDGTPNYFVNVTGMQRLHNGAIWQQYEATQKLTQAMYKLAAKTLGKEEADKLLDEEEIKLLN